MAYTLIDKGQGRTTKEIVPFVVRVCRTRPCKEPLVSVLIAFTPLHSFPQTA